MRTIFNPRQRPSRQDAGRSVIPAADRARSLFEAEVSEDDKRAPAGSPDRDRRSDEHAMAAVFNERERLLFC
jgi:hypothetical protein